MLGKIITAAVGFFSQGVGNKVGATVTNVASIGALLVALYPIWIWFDGGGKDQVLFTLSFTVGESIFLGLIAFAFIKVVHYTRAGNPHNRLPPNVD